MNDERLRGLTARLSGLPFDPHESDDWQDAWAIENDMGRTESERRSMLLSFRVGDLSRNLYAIEKYTYDLRVSDAASSRFLELAERLNGLGIFVREMLHAVAVERDALRLDEYKAKPTVVETDDGGRVAGVVS